MLTGFVQNIEISRLFPTALFHVCPGEESCTETPCAAFRNSFAHFYHEI